MMMNLLKPRNMLWSGFLRGMPTKKRTFKGTHVHKAWQRLVEQNWLPVAPLR